MSSTELSEKDLAYLREAIKVSQQARDEGQHPFGCIIVDENDNVIMSAGNRVPDGDVTQHAETRAVGLITKTRRDLEKCTLYTSTEPCAMCSGAIFWSGIRRMIFGLSNENLIKLTQKSGECPPLYINSRDILGAASHPIEVVGPYIEDEAIIPHKGFWDGGR
ncbi:cytosine deaminase [Schizosaccharomyces pombe]|uniref:Probable cytosine deaminase n=1 Tax=Schizosaccharomyces pombe (strain 972 / ATCC 24843) TaxID=284812 RepID=FCYS_SCHPO|nr:putative cytosine deaminase [Schizosaccharomyces pombe]O59834.1 RecName: Full=Probable cytosine deaminase; AltName: Full=Cytosine aminohydrolase [Schizosaccharomyces pombe 972h-]CAA19074.1 cytosine deaminase (predicted) [Schizosaccharomyces pombe]|eukprot:NP_588524.1 putative cytosine deaminase [Schizosaccharomyces pombe]